MQLLQHLPVFQLNLKGVYHDTIATGSLPVLSSRGLSDILCTVVTSSSPNGYISGNSNLDH